MRDSICQSADKELEHFISSLECETSHHRMVSQEIKCGYGLGGVCCRLCSNGPCRVSHSRPRGVCGADADTIVMRNFLRSVAAGSGCYIHIVENTAKRLKEAASGRRYLPGVHMLYILCEKLGIQGCDDWDLALKFSNVILADLHRPLEEKMELVKKLAYSDRFNRWNEIGILPGGAKDEVFNATIKTSTNLNSDPEDMAMQCLRLGISTGIYGLVLTNLLNDVLLGEPEISCEPAGFCVIDPDCINIMITGHQQSMLKDLIEKLGQKEISRMAGAVGAKNIRIVGCTCVGQDFQLRHSHCGEVFCGHAGNNYTSEAVLMTGCIDLVLSEFNCTVPGLEPICEKMGIPMLCLDDVAKKRCAQMLAYCDAEREEVTAKILSSAMASYGRRVGVKKRQNPMADHGYRDVITGITDQNLKTAMGGSLQPFIDVIASGRIKGIAAVVGCSNLRAKGHDVFTVELVKKLIEKDILVVSAGCTCGGLENCGLMSKEAKELAGDGLRAVCEELDVPPVLNFGPCLAIGRIELLAGQLAKALGVDLCQLPIVVSAPQWLEEQALADGMFALALGFPLHLGLAPFVTGSEAAVELMTERMKSITGGFLFIETEIESAAEAFERIIADKRRGLSLDE